jgi:DNA primase
VSPQNNDELRRAIDAIKLRAPIEDVVRERVPALRKSGALWVACCPFHDERTPSFKVDPRRGTWHCFGACGTGGDPISFVQRFDNVEFWDALEILAARTGVELPRRGHGSGESAGVDRDVYAVLEHATRFYRGEMRTTEGQAAQRYMRSRGLTDLTSEAFGVGYAPSNGNAFVQASRAAGLVPELCEKAGLVRRTDQGRPYDFFRGRLMIPIRDLQGRTVGFGARRLSDEDESGPKYVNTAETELFHKGRLVYALDRALPEVRKSGRIVLVEGYTDVMAAHQCGVATVVAVLGTSTTDDHAALIRRTGARKISLVFDGDEAGRKAAYKALHGLLPLEVEIEVVSLPGGDDPCDLLVREGAQAFLAQLEMAQSWFDFLLGGLRDKSGPDLSREADRVLELLTRLAKPVHRDARIAELSAALRMPVDTLREQYHDLPATRVARRAQATKSGTQAAPALAAPDRQSTALYEELLGLVLIDAGLWRAAERYLERCPDPVLTRIATAIAALYEDGESAIDASSVMSALGEDPARDRVAALGFRTEIESPKEFFDALIQKLELRALLDERTTIDAQFAELDRLESAPDADRSAFEHTLRDLVKQRERVEQRIAQVAPPTPVLPYIRPQARSHG